MNRKNNISMLLVGIYGIILIGALIAFYMLPDDQMLHPLPEGDKALQNAGEAKLSILDANLEDSEESFVKVAEWSFDVPGNVVNLHAKEGLKQNVFTVVQEKDTEDGKIDIVQYVTRTIVEYVDITERSRTPLQLALDASGIAVAQEAPREAKIILRKFNPNYSVMQFADRHIARGSGGTFMSGMQVLLVRVPKGVHVEGNGISIVDKAATF